MTDTSNWKPDPYGVHELRFFSADGKPTLLVMDGGKTSYDKPPATVPPVAPSPPDREVLPPHSQSQASVAPGVGQVMAPSGSALAVQQENEHGQTVSATVPTALLAPGGEASEARREQAAARRAPPVTVVHPTTALERREAEPLGRSFKLAYGIVLGVMAVSALGLLLVHLHSASKGSAHVETAKTAAASDHATTTTVALPTALQTSADAAAQALISGWSTGNKSAALTVATPTAVATLFAASYTSGLAIDRGCSTAFAPIVCTFGPPGGASPTDPIYEILVSQAPGGWYVSGVKIEN